MNEMTTIRAKTNRIENELSRRGTRLKRVGRELIGPCPVCGGTDRFAVNIPKQIWNCRGCQRGGDIIALVEHLDGVGFISAIEILTGERTSTRVEVSIQKPRHHLNDDDVHDQIRSALRLWREAGPIEGTVGIDYLERERDIVESPPDVHDVLRFHRRCIFGQSTTGQWIFEACILALYRDAITNTPTGIHRIAIDIDGRLIGRKALGRKQGSAVKLWGDAEVTTGLVLGEGIETTLAAATCIEHNGTLLQPAWSAIDAGNLKAFPILNGSIEHLTVLADADANGCGQEAARACARRWAEARRKVEVLIPDRLGEDFNDIAKRRKQRAASR